MFVGGPGSHDPPGRISYTRATLKDLLTHAYGLVDYQQISGPGWLGEDEYDVVAKMPPDTNKEQFQSMLQNLLAERFKLTLHHETRNFPVYELVVGKSGPKLKESVVTENGDPPSMSMSYDANGQAHLKARQQSPSALATMLHRTAGRLVFDKTGLTGKYDFTLEFAFRPGQNDDSLLLDVFGAVQQQLGLRLEDKKAPFDFLVIEHAEKSPPRTETNPIHRSGRETR